MFSLALWQSALASLRSLRAFWSSHILDSVSVKPEAAHRGVLTRLFRFAWGLYGVVCFIVCFSLTFPTDLVLQRIVATIEQTSAVHVQYSKGRWTWNKGWILNDLAITKPGTMPSLYLSRLTLAPSWFGLLRGQPFPLTFSTVLYGGAAQGEINQEGSLLSLYFTLDQIALERWPFPAPWGEGRIAGVLTATGDFRGVLTEVATWSGNLTASIKNGALKPGNGARLPLPNLQTAQARAQATLKNGRLEISDLTLEADGIAARLQGAVAPRLPLEWSALDLQLTTRQTGTPPPTLVTLVSLLPTVPGSTGERRATIAGTLAAPTLK